MFIIEYRKNRNILKKKNYTPTCKRQPLWRLSCIYLFIYVSISSCAVWFYYNFSFSFFSTKISKTSHSLKMIYSSCICMIFHLERIICFHMFSILWHFIFTVLEVLFMIQICIIKMTLCSLTISSPHVLSSIHFNPTFLLPLH